MIMVARPYCTQTPFFLSIQSVVYFHQDRFEGNTTTAETFLGKFTTRPKDFKPEDKRVELIGSHDFSTVYRGEYIPIGN